MKSSTSSYVRRTGTSSIALDLEAGAFEQTAQAFVVREHEHPRLSRSGGGARPSAGEDPAADRDPRVALGVLQTASARRPPGRSTRRTSPTAASGSGMSMRPNRHSTPSTESSSSGIASASIMRCSTFPSPSSAARLRATSTISDEKSLEIRRPSSPRSGTAEYPTSPGPAASSSTVSPGCGSSAPTIHSVTGRVTFSSRLAGAPTRTPSSASSRATCACTRLDPWRRS